MFTLHRPPRVIPAFAVLLTVALSAPIVVHAQDQILADEPVLAADGQVPVLAPVAGPSWGETSRDGSVDASHTAIAPIPDTLPEALANGTRPESAHLATVPLPSEAGRVNLSDDRIANALFGEKAHGDGSGEASRSLTAPECGTDPPQSDEPWEAPPERRMPGEPY
jgi:hypothetical protein